MIINQVPGLWDFKSTHLLNHLKTLKQTQKHSLCKHRQLPGCVIHFSYKDGSYFLSLTFVLQVEDSFDNIISYRSIGSSHQGTIDYIEPKSNNSTPTTTPSGRPSMITPP